MVAINPTTGKPRQTRKKSRMAPFADLVETMKVMTWPQAALHYGIGRSTLTRMINDLPASDRAIISAAGAARSNRGGGYRLPRYSGSNIAAAPQTTTAAHAADVLRRVGYVPVFDAGKVYGRAMDGVYVVGRLRLPVAEMISLAVSKGFDNDAWRRVAA